MAPLEDAAAACEKTCFLDGASAKSDAEEKRDCKGEETVRCELVEFDALPDYLKDNEFIVGHYRCEWPLKETFLSILSVHNETLNIWTHLLGFFIFLCLTVLTTMMLPRDPKTAAVSIEQDSHSQAPLMDNIASSSSSSMLQPAEELLQTETQSVVVVVPSSSPNGEIPGFLSSCLPPQSFFHGNNLSNACLLSSVKEDDISDMASSPSTAQPITRWPFFAFLGGTMLCLLTSSLCHLLICHSRRTASLMLRLDYAGIAVLIVTSFFPVVFYPFLCRPFYRHLYLGLITAFGAAAAAASLVPAFQSVAFRPARAALFSCMAASGVVPIGHKLAVFGDRPEAVRSAAYEAAMAACYGMGVAVYVARVPERWRPGRFDVVGHSHQLFHVLVIAGACAHYMAGVVYLQWRDLERCS